MPLPACARSGVMQELLFLIQPFFLSRQDTTAFLRQRCSSQLLGAAGHQRTLLGGFFQPFGLFLLQLGLTGFGVVDGTDEVAPAARLGTRGSKAFGLGKSLIGRASLLAITRARLVEARIAQQHPGLGQDVVIQLALVDGRLECSFSR